MARRTIALTQGEEDLLDSVINKKRIYEDYSSAIRSAVRIAFGGTERAPCKEHNQVAGIEG